MNIAKITREEAIAIRNRLCQPGVAITDQFAPEGSELVYGSDKDWIIIYRLKDNYHVVPNIWYNQSKEWQAENLRRDAQAIETKCLSPETFKAQGWTDSDIAHYKGQAQELREKARKLEA